MMKKTKPATGVCSYLIVSHQEILSNEGEESSAKEPAYRLRQTGAFADADENDMAKAAKRFQRRAEETVDDFEEYTEGRSEPSVRDPHIWMLSCSKVGLTTILLGI